MEINGTFDAQRFYQTLANIIGNREGVEITAIVHEKPRQEEKPERMAAG